MYGLNAFAIVVFGCWNVLAYQLCKQPEATRRRVLTVLSAVLLGLNLLRYMVVYPLVQGEVRFPVEFSTVAYFVVPTVLLSGSKSLHSWAAYSGLMAGFFYYLTMILAGGKLYAASAPYDVYLSLFCHGAIYCCGFVVISEEAFAKSDRFKLMAGVGFVCLRAMILRRFVDGGERYLIYILLDGTAVRTLLPVAAWHIALPIYYVLMVALVLLTMRGFLRRNHQQFRKFSKQKDVMQAA